jgi:hypothetical protein
LLRKTFHNYDQSEVARVYFHLSNGNNLQLLFPEQGSCILLTETRGSPITTASQFKREFNCTIGFVPVLGPVEHIEQLHEREAARLALFNYRVARNFRNIWHHFPELFPEFREAIRSTWPGMDVKKPEVSTSYGKPRLHMFCPEERIDREIFWAGFGFQVWCQMLTHVIQSKSASIFLIDEPDIYLHSDLQRQLLGLLRNLGPDILIATHSTEMIVEAEMDEIALISKAKRSARRIRDPGQLEQVFAILGSNMNPILTQLAKTRRALFVEGKDFQILGKFARKLHSSSVANRANFAVIPIEGFSPERVRHLIAGIETTLGKRVSTGVSWIVIIVRSPNVEASSTAVDPFATSRLYIRERKLKISCLSHPLLTVRQHTAFWIEHVVMAPRASSMRSERLNFLRRSLSRRRYL